MSESAQPDAGEREAVLDVCGVNYGHIGVDAEGEHHHFDRTENRILVSTGGYEAYTPPGSDVYHYRVYGEVVREVDLDEYDGLDAGDWEAHVAAKRGWDQRPPDYAGALSAAFGEVSHV